MEISGHRDDSGCPDTQVRPDSALGSFGSMSTITKKSRLRLLRSLFYISEGVVVASFAGIMIESFRSPSLNPSMVIVLTFWISLLALLIVCFSLRRAARPLAVTGWTTALILVLVGLIIPRL